MNIPDSATHKYARVFYKLVGDIWYAWTDGGWHVSRLGAEVLDSGARKLSAPVPPQADAQPVAFADWWKGQPLGDTADIHDSAQTYFAEQVWNGCLNEVEKLYTHADAGEVERLRTELKTWKTRAERHNITLHREIDKARSLRAKLAERDALLTDLGVEPEDVSDIYQRVLLNAKRYEYLREHMTTENFPPAHPSWSQPSEHESRRIDEMCDTALSTSAEPGDGHDH